MEIPGTQVRKCYLRALKAIDSNFVTALLQSLKTFRCKILENLCLCLSLLKGEFRHHRMNLRGQRTFCLRQLSPAISGEAPCLNASRAWGQLTQTDLPSLAPHLGPKREGGSG